MHQPRGHQSWPANTKVVGEVVGLISEGTSYKDLGKPFARSFLRSESPPPILLASFFLLVVTEFALHAPSHWRWRPISNPRARRGLPYVQKLCLTAIHPDSNVGDARSVGGSNEVVLVAAAGVRSVVVIVIDDGSGRCGQDVNQTYLDPGIDAREVWDDDDIEEKEVSIASPAAGQLWKYAWLDSNLICISTYGVLGVLDMSPAPPIAVLLVLRVVIGFALHVPFRCEMEADIETRTIRPDSDVGDVRSVGGDNGVVFVAAAGTGSVVVTIGSGGSGSEVVLYLVWRKR
ncbi:uncharacterized protein EV420DRAFT_1486849 [Desarmillaria tabescens]|uniref:Uncharacterized protein n=1 Tax=Armillaria tabescens TaxID=1929756 RepID=A0AA39J889_ARMTA|nr:uncharacterized protein EV420DRAFT_1486849 [Desarmillaria tabescens]KAK0437977.1 hypothetical protein EV420DRAFT_1486849 [Desarmillaria tabescens]